MLDLNSSGLESLIPRLEYAQALYQTGADPDDIPAQLYCRFLPDTAPQQGELMAKHLQTRIREFDQTREQFCIRSEAEIKDLIIQQFKDVLHEKSLYQQCSTLDQLLTGMGALDRGIAERVQPKANSGWGYSGESSESARNHLLQKVAEQILDEPTFPNELEKPCEIPRWLVWAARARLSEMDDDACRAILSMCIYTMLIEGACENILQGSPVSIDYVAAEVCRNYVTEQEEHSGRSPAVDWSVVKVLLAIGILTGGCSVVVLSNSIAVVYGAYYATVLSVGALLLSCSGQDQLPVSTPEAVSAERKDWARDKARDVAQVREQLKQEQSTAEEQMDELNHNT